MKSFRVVLCRIRLFPTLISKIKWLGFELLLIFQPILNLRNYFSHLRNFVNQEFQRLLTKYPQIMAEIKIMTNELHPDAQKKNQV